MQRSILSFVMVKEPEVCIRRKHCPIHGAVSLVYKRRHTDQVIFAGCSEWERCRAGAYGKAWGRNLDEDELAEAETWLVQAEKTKIREHRNRANNTCLFCKKTLTKLSSTKSNDRWSDRNYHKKCWQDLRKLDIG